MAHLKNACSVMSEQPGENKEDADWWTGVTCSADSQSVDPRDWDPLRTRVQLLHEHFQLPNCLVNVIIDDHVVKIVSVRLAQKFTLTK